MRRANVVSGVVLAMVGLVMLVAVIPAQIEAGPADMVSPRLVPNLTMILVVALSVVLVVGNLRATDGEASEGAVPVISRSEAAAMLKIGAIFAVALALHLLLSPLAGAAALVVGSLLALGERRPLVVVLMPAALLLGLWLVFYKVLGTAIV